MTRIAAGSFEADGKVYELPAYCLDTTEVTIAAYAQCVEAKKCSVPEPPTSLRTRDLSAACNWKVAGREQHPANCVTWEQAFGYCASIGRRLPAAPEWDWAARGRDERRDLPWKDAPATPPPAAAGEDDGFPFTAPVGSFPAGASRDGLLDMAGNVAEWTLNLRDASSHFTMGGSFDDEPGLRVASRLSADPTTGLRCAAPLDPVESAVERCPEGMKFVLGGFDYLADPPAKVAGVCLDETEVTVAAYRACVDSGGCRAPGEYTECNWRRESLADHPIDCVDFDQAAGFCSAHGKRLPTKAEWRWAAQGRDEGRSHPWGVDPVAPERARDGKRRSTDPVGRFPAGASRDGVLDMVGNVTEWTAKGEEPDLLCGSSYDEGRPASDCNRSYRRTHDTPGTGFRCAAAPR